MMTGFGEDEKMFTSLEADKSEAAGDNSDNSLNTRNSRKWWKRIPGFGLMLIIFKNILGGITDVVVKKIENIGRQYSSRNELMMLFMPYCSRCCQLDILPQSGDAHPHNTMEYNKRSATLPS